MNDRPVCLCGSRARAASVAGRSNPPEHRYLTTLIVMSTSCSGTLSTTCAANARMPVDTRSASHRETVVGALRETLERKLAARRLNGHHALHGLLDRRGLRPDRRAKVFVGLAVADPRICVIAVAALVARCVRPDDGAGQSGAFSGALVAWSAHAPAGRKVSVPKWTFH